MNQFLEFATTPGLLIQLGSTAFNALADGIYGVWVNTLAPFLVSLPGAILGSRIRRTFVKAHQDVGTQNLLDFNGLLRAEKVEGSVDV